MTSTRSPDDVRQWERIAKQAAEQRRHRIEVMDAYDVAEGNCELPSPFRPVACCLNIASANSDADCGGNDKGREQTAYEIARSSRVATTRSKDRGKEVESCFC